MSGDGWLSEAIVHTLVVVTASPDIWPEPSRSSILWACPFAPSRVACVEAALPGFNVMPQFNTTVPGTYRIVWGGYSSWNPSGTEPGLGMELPLAATISNEFELQESAN